MRNHFILSILAITMALSSCKKEDVIGPGGSGVFKDPSVFPLKEGDVWRCDIVTYSWPEMTRVYESHFDTIKAPQKRDDGREYFSFFSEFYTLLDDNTLQKSFDNVNFWTSEVYPGEFIWFQDVKKTDTLSVMRYYSDVGPNKSLTIAYPEDTMINGRQCKRTEIVYLNEYNNEDHYIGKKVLYFSKGNGPVYEAEYWAKFKLNDPNGNDKAEIVKVWEKFYKQVVFSKD